MAKNKNVDGLKYKGEIKVTVKKGNKVLSSQKYKNAGRWPLFYFLNNALKGDYSLAENWRPKFILLFQAAPEGDDIPIITTEGATWDSQIQKYANYEHKSSFTPVPYSEDPVVYKTESLGIGSGYIIYKFIIPFTHIDIKKDTNLIGIYSKEAVNSGNINYGEPSMYFFIPKGTTPPDNTKLGNIVQLDDNEKDTEYNLFIEWKLTISNETKEN